MKKQLIRIVLADDHPLIRSGLVTCLKQDDSLELVAEAADGLAALAAVLETSPDIAILDIDMPHMDGLAVAQELQRQGSTARVIMLTLHAEEAMLKRALELGAKGYLLKESAPQEVIAAVHAVRAGASFISSSLTSRLLMDRNASTDSTAVSPLSALTASEVRILRLVGEGLTSKEIAERLSIHYRTVENHRTNMCRKLNVDGTSALLRFALNHKALIDRQ